MKDFHLHEFVPVAWPRQFDVRMTNFLSGLNACIGCGLQPIVLALHPVVLPEVVGGEGGDAQCFSTFSWLVDECGQVQMDLFEYIDEPLGLANSLACDFVLDQQRHDFAALADGSGVDCSSGEESKRVRPSQCQKLLAGGPFVLEIADTPFYLALTHLKTWQNPELGTHYWLIDAGQLYRLDHADPNSQLYHCNRFLQVCRFECQGELSLFLADDSEGIGMQSLHKKRIVIFKGNCHVSWAPLQAKDPSTADHNSSFSLHNGDSAFLGRNRICDVRLNPFVDVENEGGLTADGTRVALFAVDFVGADRDGLYKEPVAGLFLNLEGAWEVELKIVVFVEKGRDKAPVEVVVDVDVDAFTLRHVVPFA